MDPLLNIRGLEVRLFLKEGTVCAVNGLDLQIPSNRTIGLVGESGCGKSITARAILNILPPRGRITSGTLSLKSRDKDGLPLDLAALRPNSVAMRRIRGRDISMIFQEPMTSLSPVHTIGDQIGEVFRLHRAAGRAEARRLSAEILAHVGVPMPERRVDSYPHELSGGLRQRCMIAMALACRPRLLIADEPTTALDVTIQAQIIALIQKLQADLSMAVLIITHNLGVVAEIADEVAVMYLGRIVEHGPTRQVFSQPQHPYTRGLLDSLPKLGSGNAARLTSIPGSVPDPFTMPPGCPFHPRCLHAIGGVCACGRPPELTDITPSHRVACWLYSHSHEPRDAR